MKHTAFITVLSILALTGCEKKASEPFVPDPVMPAQGALPPGHPPIDTSGDSMSSSERTDVEMTQKATVVSAINIPQFTYLEIRQGNQTRWLASATIAAKKGDDVQFDHGETVTNFNSKALMRTFPSITFVNRVDIVKSK